MSKGYIATYQVFFDKLCFLGYKRMSSSTSKNASCQQQLPCIPYGLDIQRRHYFQSFVKEHFEGLRYLYERLLTTQQKEHCTLDEWITFAFESTSLDGLQTYK